MLTRREEFVSTPSGTLRIDWVEPANPRAVVSLGHGSATGVEAGDLQALAEALPEVGYTVALITYPYRLTGQASGRAPSALDAAFEAAYPQLAAAGVPVIAGGRSAGSQVVCRTGGRLGAVAVLALAYPILGPGSARELKATMSPFLVVQGTDDPFGVPKGFPALGPQGRLVAIPGAGHMLGTAGSARPFQAVVDAVVPWLEKLSTAAEGGSGRTLPRYSGLSRAPELAILLLQLAELLQLRAARPGFRPGVTLRMPCPLPQRLRTQVYLLAQVQTRSSWRRVFRWTI